MEIINTRPALGSIMIQGTASNAGKSLIAAGLCRAFYQDGWSVAPFKSQNMALNSYITASGGEMGRAQVVQAEAAGIEPEVSMNPILLKPTSDQGSQVIVNGTPVGTMKASEYFTYKSRLIPHIRRAYESLCEGRDIIVIEGAGSPAEINLKDEDIVNMGVARMTRSPVLLVADIDRGGVFASIYGTLMLLEPEERAMVKGVIINKFRGDPDILKPGLAMIEEKTGVPVLGVMPYMTLDIDDEDSLSERIHLSAPALIKIAVIRLPRMSNFTDLNVFDRTPGAAVSYVSSLRELGDPDMIVLPGSKNTIADLLWMRQNGLEAAILKRARTGTVVFGICGGYQMLGKELSDPRGVEAGGTIAGMGLLDISSVFAEEKRTVQVSGRFGQVLGPLSGLSGKTFSGYEIHCGVTQSHENSLVELTSSGGEAVSLDDGAQHSQGLSVYGSYVHGLFDEKGIASEIVNALLLRKGYAPIEAESLSFKEYKDRQYSILAQGIRDHINLERIYEILKAGI